MKKYDKEIMQAQLDNEKAVLKQLENNYSDALEEINSKIANLMGRADADMQHVIYQVEYQKALKKQIEGILLNLQTNEFETVSEYLTKCYEEGFLGTMYSMQSQGVPLVFPINQEEVVAAIQHETNLTSSLYNAFDTKDLQKKIAGEISRGFSTGALYKDVARNVAAVTNIGRNNAMRIARTEGHRITETAAHNAQLKAKDRGADVVKIWDAALDSRTRPSHVKVDGEIKEVEEKFSNGLMFPGDPSGAAAEVINCRCRSRTDARWALDADETKMLGDVSKMSEAQKQAIADKLGIPVEDLDLYSGQIVPIKAKDYADFKNQYKQYWNYKDSALAKEVEPRIAKLEAKRTGKKGFEESNKPLENSDKSDKMNVGNAVDGSDGGVLDNFSRKRSVTEYSDDLKKVNPNYATGEYKWRNNCQRCVSTYEMRRRGYDVTAKPIPGKAEDDYLAQWFEHAWKNADRKWCMKGSGKAEIEKWFEKWGDGARAVVGVGFSPTEGHVFIAERINGKVIYIDPQTGNEDVSEYFKRAVKGRTHVTRIDNLAPSEHIVDCCEDRK